MQGDRKEGQTAHKIPNQMTQEGEYLDDLASELPGEGRQGHLAFSIFDPIPHQVQTGTFFLECLPEKAVSPALEGNGGKALLEPH